MTEDEELLAAMEKAKVLFAKVEQMASELPPEKKHTALGMRAAAHSMVANLAEAIRIKKG